MSEEIRKQQGFDPLQSAGLFVGIRHFDNTSIAEVPFAADDAVDMAYLFTFSLGLISPTRVTIALSGEPQKQESQRRLNQLRTSGAAVVDGVYTQAFTHARNCCVSASKDGLLVVFFATHGFLDEKNDQRLLMKDTDKEYLEETSVPMSQVLAAIGKSDCPRRLLFIDACREIVSNDTRKIESGLSLEFARQLSEAKGMATLLGTTYGGYCYDDHSSKNGVFTKAILSAFQSERGAEPDDRGLITIESLKDYCNSYVKNWIKRNRSHDIGRSTGIGYNLEDPDCARLPLAYSSEAYQEYQKYREQYINCLGRIKSVMDYQDLSVVYADLQKTFESTDSGNGLLIPSPKTAPHLLRVSAPF